MGKLRFRDGKGLVQGHQASMCVVQVKWLRGLQAAKLTMGLHLPAFETQVLETKSSVVGSLQRLGLELGTLVHRPYGEGTQWLFGEEVGRMEELTVREEM